MNAPNSQVTLQPSLAALPLIKKWVSFASVSRDSNLPIIEWTRELLEAQGIECHLSYDDSHQKANLLGHFART